MEIKDEEMQSGYIDTIYNPLKEKALKFREVWQDCDVKIWDGKEERCQKERNREMRIRTSPSPYTGWIVCLPSLQLQNPREDEDADFAPAKVLGIE